MALLVEVHPHYKRFPQLLSLFHESCPRRVNPQNITYHHFSVGFFGSRNYPPGPFDGVGKGFLDKHMAPCFESHYGKRLVGIGVGGDADRIGFGFPEGKGIITKKGVVAAEFFVQHILAVAC